MATISARTTSLPAPIVVPPSFSWDGNDGSWSTFSINVGTPGQDFRVLMSTAASSIYIPLEGVCPEEKGRPSDCLESRGILPFRSEQNIGFQTEQSSSWESFNFFASEFEADLGLNFNASYGFDTVQLGASSDSGAFTMTDQNVGAFVDDRFWLGFFGLNTQAESLSTTRKPFDSFFGSLDLSLVPSYSYSYGAGAAYQGKGVAGSMIFGGYDTARFEPSGVSFSFNEDPGRLLTLGVQSIITTDTLKGDFGITSSGHLSAIDSTVSQLWLPNDVCDKFVEAFGLTYDKDTGLFLVNDTIHEKLQDLNPQLTFRLGNSAEDAGDFVNIVLPYAAFDLQASYPIYDKPTNYFPIQRAPDTDSYTLGRAFLQQAYLIVDYAHKNFTVNQAIFSDPMPDPDVATIYPLGYSPGSSSDPGSSGNPSSTGGDSNSDGTSSEDNSSGSSGGSSSGVSGGAIGGIVVGVIAVIVLLGIAWLLWSRKKRESPPPPEMEEDADSEATLENPIQKTQSRTDAHELASSDMGSPPMMPFTYYQHRKTDSLSELSGGPTPSEMPSPPPLYEMEGEYMDLPRRPPFSRSSSQLPGSGPSTPGLGLQHVELPTPELETANIVSPEALFSLNGPSTDIAASDAQSSRAVSPEPRISDVTAVRSSGTVSPDLHFSEPYHPGFRSPRFASPEPPIDEEPSIPRTGRFSETFDD